MAEKVLARNGLNSYSISPDDSSSPNDPGWQRYFIYLQPLDSSCLMTAVIELWPDSAYTVPATDSDPADGQVSVPGTCLRR
jgi:hypothetical protein